MRRLIAMLRDMEPSDPQYDQTFMELIRDVMHHAAEEETVVLPAAESVLGAQLAAAAGLLAGLYLLSRLTHAQR